MDVLKVYKTCIYKIHNPSRRRRARLYDSLMRADRAYWKALGLIHDDVHSLVGLAKKERRAALNELAKKVAGVLKPLPLSNAAKAGVKLDVLAQADSYLQLIETGQDAAWPVKGADSDPYYDGLLELVSSTTREQYNAARDMMHTRPPAPGPRPQTIVQNRKGDGAMIMEDDTGRLFAYINLDPKDSRHSRPCKIANMVHTRTGEVMSWTARTGELFPLECSDWHKDKFIRKGRIQSSRLIYRRGEFYFAATFLFESEPVETSTVLGIDRGIDQLAAYAVINSNLNVMEDGALQGASLRNYQRKAEAMAAEHQRKKGLSKRRWRGFGDHVIHMAANQIVGLALKHKSQVVLENLTNIANGPHMKRGKFKKKSNFARMLNRQQYQKLEEVLLYKLKAVGLPPPKKVRAAYTSQTCFVCGHRDKANRKSQSEFICEACGYTHHADVNAAAVIAAKHVWWEDIKDGVKKGSKLKEEQRFDVWFKRQANVAVPDRERVRAAENVA